MRNAARLLSLLILCGLLLNPSPAYAAPVSDEPAAPAVSDGAVYTVAAGAADPALTAVDCRFSGDGQDDSGVQFMGGSRYYYGAVISDVTYGAVIDSADDGYFGSSAGAIPLYDPRGVMAGVVWGDGRPTQIQCWTGFLLRGDVAGCVLVDDATQVTALDAIVLYEGGSGRIVFNNARLRSDAGLLLDTSADAEGVLSLTFSNGSYEGDVRVASPAADVSVLVGRGALLHGNVLIPEDADGSGAALTVAADGTWAPSTASTLSRLQVEEGASVYARVQDDKGVLTVYPDGEALEPGIYEPTEPLTEALPFGRGPAVDDAPDPEPTPAQDEDETASAAAGSALGLALATQAGPGDALPSALSAASVSQGLLFHLTAAPVCQTSVAATLKFVLTNSNSFVAETLDKPAIILYNPYCCLAA